MPAKMFLSVYDNVHNQNATGIEYDLWRVGRNNTNRVNIKHGTITDGNMHQLIQANTAEDLDLFEIVLYVKDYFDRFNENIDVRDSRMIIPFGMSDFNRDEHLSIHITPTGFSCTL